MAQPQKLQTPTTSNGYTKYYAVTLFLISILAYSNTFTHGFVLDDEAVITKNKFVQAGLSGIKDIFTTFYWKGYWNLNSGIYRPLSLVIFSILRQFFGENALVFHFVNVLLYATVVVALYKFLQNKLLSNYTATISFLVALLFSVHPMHSEVVANIKSLDELLHCLFFLATLYYLNSKKISHQILSSQFFLLALLSKESALLLIPIALLYLIQLQNFQWLQAIKKLIPLTSIAIIWLIIRTYIIHSNGALAGYTYEDNSMLACNNFISKKLTAIYTLALYLVKLIYPVNLSYDYSFNQIPCLYFNNIEVWLSLLLIITLATIAIKYFFKKPIVSFGILFFFITSSLTNNIFLPIGTTMADRLMFTPYIGLLVALIYFLHSKLSSTNLQTSKVLITITVVLTLVFTAKAIQRNRNWESNETLFEADIEHATNSARVHYNYGTILLNTTTNYSLALDELQKAYDINPNNTNIWANLGVANYKNKNYKKAIFFLKDYVQKKPDDYLQKLNLADAYVKDNQFDSAIIYYNNALANKTYQPNTHNFLGTAFFNLKQYEKAEKAFSEGLKIYPTNTEMLINYGNVLAAQKKYNDAINVFTKVITIEPNSKQALYFLALVHNDMGNKEKANEYLQKYNSLK